MGLGQWHLIQNHGWTSILIEKYAPVMLHSHVTKVITFVFVKIIATTYFHLRLLSATGTIFSVANYLWPPSEYTIAIVLVTDCHRAVTVIIFTFWRFLKCPRKPFCPNLDEARWTRDRHQPPLIQLPMILGFRQPDRQQTWQPPVLPAAERQQSVAAWPKSSEAGRCHGAR